MLHIDFKIGVDLGEMTSFRTYGIESVKALQNFEVGLLLSKRGKLSNKRKDLQRREEQLTRAIAERTRLEQSPWTDDDRDLLDVQLQLHWLRQIIHLTASTIERALENFRKSQPRASAVVLQQEAFFTLHSFHPPHASPCPNFSAFGGIGLAA